MNVSISPSLTGSLALEQNHDLTSVISLSDNLLNTGCILAEIPHNAASGGVHLGGDRDGKC